MEQSYTEMLRARGYRVTPQREMIIETILQAKRHMTAEEIMTELRKRTQVINIATVYRTLELLVE
jgi:Fur family ferric uptake transcriptional regulator